MSDKEDGEDGKDQILLGPEDQSGRRFCLRHRPDHSIETAMVADVEDGKPILPGSEIVRLTPNDGNLMDVEVLHDGSGHRAPSKGPAKVATKAFRDSWDRIFGTRPTIGES